MICRGQFLVELTATGQKVDVLDLDELSFRAWLVELLFDAGAIAAQAGDGDTPFGNPVSLRLSRGGLERRTLQLERDVLLRDAVIEGGIDADNN